MVPSFDEILFFVWNYTFLIFDKLELLLIFDKLELQCDHRKNKNVSISPPLIFQSIEPGLDVNCKNWFI